MTATHRTDIHVDTGTGESEYRALFSYDTEFHRADRSTGHNEDRDEVTSCELVSWWIGSLKLDRYHLITALSKAEVEAIEAEKSDDIQAGLDCGELELAA